MVSPVTLKLLYKELRITNYLLPFSLVTVIFGLSQAILTRFYCAVIESVLSFSITVWFGCASQDEINQIESVVKNTSKLIGLNMPSIRSLYQSQSLRKSKRIVQDAYHPANHLFELLPSGKRYRCIKTKMTRFNNSFYPQALRFLKGESQHKCLASSR